MSIAALVTWLATILASLILLVIWIIEYDPGPDHGGALGSGSG